MTSAINPVQVSPAEARPVGVNQVREDVTVWYAWDHQRLGFAFNHIESGRPGIDKPTDPFNRKWKNNRWERRDGVLSPGGRWGSRVLSISGSPVPQLLSHTD